MAPVGIASLQMSMKVILKLSGLHGAKPELAHQLAPRDVSFFDSVYSAISMIVRTVSAQLLSPCRSADVPLLTIRDDEPEIHTVNECFFNNDESSEFRDQTHILHLLQLMPRPCFAQVTPRDAGGICRSHLVSFRTDLCSNRGFVKD
jgi:hypothetical protein